MSKGTKSMKNINNKSQAIDDKANEKNKGYLFGMSMAPTLEQSTHWFQMLPIAFFSAVVIIITRMAEYERPMSQFFWSDDKNQMFDFFSYDKMVAILICAGLALIILLYRLFIQSFSIKRSFAYIPMIIYTLFVLASYFLSDYKIFALWGWNDRFEGTVTLLAYMVMLFFIVNSINTEKNIKWVIYPIAATSAILGILGLSQAFGHDFFRTMIGKKLITPSWYWDHLGNLNFTFQNNEIYQTVYNINYVSFYLTLLIPLFGMLFIKSMVAGKEEAIWKKIAWGILFTLLVFNLIGSASSGGLMGMAVVVLAGIIVINKKIMEWKKPILILLILTILVAGASYSRWWPELSNAINGVVGTQNHKASTANSEADVENIRHKVDYIETTGPAIIMSIEGNEIAFITFPDDPTALKIKDASGKSLPLTTTNVNAIYRVEDARFDRITVRPAKDEANNNYLMIGTDGNEWPFRITPEGPKYYNGLGKLVSLHKVPSVGWEANQSFGSGRGYIWSRTIPMLKDAVLIGHGADTYCLYFPQEDYAGKYNSGTFSENINIVVDKPHNMYFDAIIGTGGISMLSLLALWGIYLVQSFRLYRRHKYDSFASYAGAGIFLGICGFLVSGLVNDSSVSVMPMFYGLLGTGIAINALLKSQSSSK